jgi:sRNA-binding regulator protein Hfq
MSDKAKLILALQQVDNLASLLNSNKYQKLLYSHLISIKVELKRQLSNLKNDNGNT